jgi:hypothetical protein
MRRLCEFYAELTIRLVFLTPLREPQRQQLRTHCRNGNQKLAWAAALPLVIAAIGRWTVPFLEVVPSTAKRQVESFSAVRIVD